ncbi:hypothetical protein ABIF56_001584 [Bradyrhizobium elkanii]
MDLADRAQREEVVEGQRAERPDHAERRERDPMRRDVGERGENDAGIDALQGVNKRRDRERDDQHTRGDPEPFPADLFLETTPKRGQQPKHSSSRRGGNFSGTRSRTATGDGQTHRTR